LDFTSDFSKVKPERDFSHFPHFTHISRRSTTSFQHNTTNEHASKVRKEGHCGIDHQEDRMSLEHADEPLRMDGHPLEREDELIFQFIQMLLQDSSESRFELSCLKIL
jgi:hypothetical protein